MQVKLVGDWARLAKMAQELQEKMDKAIDRTLKQEARLFKEYAKDAIISRGASNQDPWPKLSKWSEAMAGTHLPLLNTRLLYNSIGAVRYGKLAYIAGVKSKEYPRKRGAKSGPKTTVDVASIHEKGAFYIMRMTAKMLFFLINLAEELGLPPKPGNGKSLGAFITVRIPRRSFLRSTELAHFSDSKRQARAERNFEQFMKAP